MAITILGYSFDGPYINPSTLAKKAGVYVVLREDTKKVLDVGESGNVVDRLESHDRKDCWDRNRGTASLRYAAHYVSYGREAIEKKIRDAKSPPCGKI